MNKKEENDWMEYKISVTMGSVERYHTRPRDAAAQRTFGRRDRSSLGRNVPSSV